MENISILAQLVVSISVIIVWVFRYENIVAGGLSMIRAILAIGVPRSHSRQITDFL